MKASAEDRKFAHNSWLRSLEEARNRCRQAMLQSSVDVANPHRALWPHVGRSQMTTEHQTVAQAHAAVLDYAQHVAPFQNRCSMFWTEELVEPHEFPDGEKFDVALSEISEWADRRYVIESEESHELTGNSKTTEYRRVHIPVNYSRLYQEQLNKCLETLGLAAQLPEREDRSGRDNAF